MTMLGRSSITVLTLVAALLLQPTLATQARAEKYYPDHPAVQDMVRKAITYLSNPGGPSTPGGGAGEAILVGYTIYKVDGDTEHPVVARAIGLAKACLEQNTSSNQHSHKAVYEIALSCMLLASVDAEGYSPLLVRARDLFFRVQTNSGGFNYIDGAHNPAISDISQTQYVMLAFWTMSQAGIEIPQDRIVRIIQYITNAQIKDPSIPTSHGGWPYHWNPSASDQSRVTSHSLVACGLSSILIAGDTIGIYRNRLAQADEDEELVPAAFKRVIAETEGGKPRSSFDRSKIDAVVTWVCSSIEIMSTTKPFGTTIICTASSGSNPFLRLLTANKTRAPIGTTPKWKNYVAFKEPTVRGAVRSRRTTTLCFPPKSQQAWPCYS